MIKMFYSRSNDDVYLLHENCDLQTLMDEQAGGDGILAILSPHVMEFVEYHDCEPIWFSTTVPLTHIDSKKEWVDAVNKVVEEKMTFGGMF